MFSARPARILAVGAGCLALVAAAPPSITAQQDAVTAMAAEMTDVTFSRDIAPILQRSCQDCHRPNGVAPMPLVSYDDVRPYARRVARRTAIRDRMGAMPPWYVEKDIGIQHYKDDPSLNDEEIAAIVAWANNGAPEGNPADLPEPLVFEDGPVWSLGEPDLIVKSEDILVRGDDPDWWGDITPVPIPIEQDRYVASVEIREVNDYDPSAARETVGGRFVIHHMIWSTRVLQDEGDSAPGAETEGAVGWPVHEVGRNPDIFDPQSGRLLRAGSSIVSNSVHLHANGVDTNAHLEFGFKFHPVGYEPTYPRIGVGLGNGVDIDIPGNTAQSELRATQVLTQNTKLVTFEPHLHAPGYRMCLEANWGYVIETLSCVGYDHNWVRGYAFADNYQPLLPKGTVLQIIGYMDNSETNQNVPDPRNWQGSGNRSVTNMFIDLGMRVGLTDEQFVEAMLERREALDLGPNDHVIGCPLCSVIPDPQDPDTAGDTSGSNPPSNER